jgi:hypothetical protein
MTQSSNGLGPSAPEMAASVLPPPSGGPLQELGMRFKRMLSAPGDAFQPPISKWVWLAPLILLSLWAFAQAILSARLWIDSPEMAAAFEQIPEDKMAGIRIFMGVGALATTWVGFLLPALVFWFGLSFVLGGRVAFGPVLAVTAFTGLVMLPRDILLTVLRLRADTIHIYTSPAVFADPERKVLIVLAEHLDIFALYRLVLLGFGFRSISGLKGKQTGWLVGVVWVLGAAFAAAMTLLGQKFGK